MSLKARNESATTFKLGTLVNKNIASKCLTFSSGFWSNFDCKSFKVYNCWAGVIANNFCLSITPWVLINYVEFLLLLLLFYSFIYSLLLSLCCFDWFCFLPFFMNFLFVVFLATGLDLFFCCGFLLFLLFGFCALPMWLYQFGNKYDFYYIISAIIFVLIVDDDIVIIKT